MLEVDGLVTPILVELPQDKPVVIGRKDDNYTPQIDLLAYGAQKHGMSRRHAALKLRRKRLDIVDLDSSNGTFINDDKLDSGEPNQLRDGDVLRLGRLKITVRFYQA